MICRKMEKKDCQLEWECPICKAIEKRYNDEIKTVLYEYEENVHDWGTETRTQQSTIEIQICSNCGALSIPVYKEEKK